MKYLVTLVSVGPIGQDPTLLPALKAPRPVGSFQCGGPIDRRDIDCMIDWQREEIIHALKLSLTFKTIYIYIYIYYNHN